MYISSYPIAFQKHMNSDDYVDIGHCIIEHGQNANGGVIDSEMLSMSLTVKFHPVFCITN